MKDGDSDQGSSGENGSNSTFFLKVKYTIFADKLHVVMKGVMPRSLA